MAHNVFSSIAKSVLSLLLTNDTKAIEPPKEEQPIDTTAQVEAAKTTAALKAPAPAGTASNKEINRRVLIIAEKKQMAAAIAEALAGKATYSDHFTGHDEKNSYCIVWTDGHTMELCEPRDYDAAKYSKWRLDALPIFPAEWRRKEIQNKKKKISVIRDKYLKSADCIIHAGDPDREGQLLVDELLLHLHNDKPVARMLLNALDKSTIKTAFASLKDNDSPQFRGMRRAAIGRARADWLVGMNLTRAYTKAWESSGHDGQIKVGRVKAPTLALLVRREEEIRNFTPVTYYELHARWKCGDTIVDTVWQPDKDYTGLNEDGLIIESHTAQSVLRSLRCPENDIGSADDRDDAGSYQAGYDDDDDWAVVTDFLVQHHEEYPVLPYSLSDLQIHAGALYGYTPDEVMDIMEELYLDGFTTYPRTGSNHLPTNQMKQIPAILGHLDFLGLPDIVQDGPLSLEEQSLAWDDTQIGAHHAIIPTTKACSMSMLKSKGERDLYNMVSAAYAAQFYPHYEYEDQTLRIECCGHVFVSIGRKVLVEGWKKLYPGEKPSELPEIAKGTQVKLCGAEIKVCQTQPPARFTPATLLQAMRDISQYVTDEQTRATLDRVSGIGTEATRSTVIKDIMAEENGLVKYEGGYLQPTEKADKIIDMLPDMLTSPYMTARWEDELDKIAAGTETINEFIGSKLPVIKKMVDDVKADVAKRPAPARYECPDCGEELVRRKNRKDGSYFWGCKGYPECNGTAEDIGGKPDMEHFHHSSCTRMP